MIKTGMRNPHVVEVRSDKGIFAKKGDEGREVRVE
jgi:hypothetical protein